MFQATVTISNSNAWGIAYFGMGNPTAAGTSGSQPFGEPLSGPNLFMVARNDTNKLEVRNNATTAAGTVQTSTAALASTTDMLRMTWNATTKQALFEFDLGNNGTINYNFTASNSNFNATNSQLVLGGGNGLIFDNVSVTAVPEPATYGLIGAGALALISGVRRRRRK